MKIKGFLKMFWMTLLIGTAFGFVLNLIAEPQYVQDQSVAGYVVALTYSSTWTAISLMGFFAYLILHRVGLDLFRGAKLWNRVQVVLIAFALFDGIYLRGLAFGFDRMPLYIGEMAVLALVAFLVARAKARETNFTAFIPTMFLMTVITLIEWIPALQATENRGMLWASLATLVMCNAYQILMLHRLQEVPAPSR
ncbi:KinB-signaling pathway activation protein [Exiguobacterium flavidum]|uniref:KinB-signaling pathway activation protein n=1 Tax=Exiguobacterium flavidum TaxID=2184695 RepID=UPI000DF76A61|nr:KinB-signaling pathway activation protein [Exiguobacterium flavidum]